MNLSWLEALKLTVPVAAVVIGWMVNEYSKRKSEEYMRKEANYRALLSALKGFYDRTANREQKTVFLEQVNLCWLYCPDEVIRKAYAFLDTIHTDAAGRTTHSDAELAVGEFVAAIRRDLLSRTIVRNTALQGNDFKHLVAN